MDWDYLQASNNFRFMTTKPSNVGLDRGIYSSPFDAFTNYMNILGDFISRVNSLYPDDIDNDELNSLLTTIKNQGDDLDVKEKEIERLQTKISKMQETEELLRERLEKEKNKATASKTRTRAASDKSTAKAASAKRTVKASSVKSAEKAPATKNEEVKKKSRILVSGSFSLIDNIYRHW